jgi:hypothetical protein
MSPSVTNFTAIDTPIENVTTAQIVAIAGAVVGVAVAAGSPLSKDLQDSTIQLISVLALLLVVGDAAIRHGRSRALLNPPRVPIEGEDAGA